MAEKMAASLEELRKLQEKDRCVVLQGTAEIGRTHLTRLLDNGWLQEVMKGWYIAARPGTEGDTTVWYTSFWYFIAKYAAVRLGEQWCLTADQSLDLYSGKTTVPVQVIIKSPKGHNNTQKLMYDTSLLVFQSEIPDQVYKEPEYGLNLYPLAEAQGLGMKAVGITGLSGIKFESGGELVGIYMPNQNYYKGYVGALELMTDQTLTAGIYNNKETVLGFAPDDLAGVYFGQCMFMGAVADGYLYCVPSPIFQQQQGINFTFFFTGTTSTIVSLMYDMMLVDESKDMGGIPGAAVQRMAEIRRSLLEGFKPGNFVELPQFSGTPGHLETILPALPVNLASDPMPAPAPSLKKAQVKTSVVRGIAQTAAAGNGLVKTAVRAK